MKSAAMPLGRVIAERRFTLFAADGAARKVWVRLGAPVATTDEGAVLPASMPASMTRITLEVTTRSAGRAAGFDAGVDDGRG